MNQETKLIKSRLGLLKLAEHLNNVTKACKLMGTPMQTFNESITLAKQKLLNNLSPAA